VKNPHLSNSNDLNIDHEFINITNEEKFNRKFFDLQKEMKIDCIEQFSISENMINDKTTKLK
jgi:hypothetical protein